MRCPSGRNSERLRDFRQIAQAEQSFFPPPVRAIRCQFIDHLIRPTVLEEFFAPNAHSPSEFRDFLVRRYMHLGTLPPGHLHLKLQGRFVCLNRLAMEVVGWVPAPIRPFPIRRHALKIAVPPSPIFDELRFRVPFGIYVEGFAMKIEGPQGIPIAVEAEHLGFTEKSNSSGTLRAFHGVSLLKRCCVDNCYLRDYVIRVSDPLQAQKRHRFIVNPLYMAIHRAGCVFEREGHLTGIQFSVPAGCRGL